MKKNLILGLLCLMAAVPVGMNAMEDGVRAHAGINLPTRIEDDINRKAKIISTTIFNGQYNAACTMYHTSISNLKKDYSGKEQANALTFFNQKIRNILTPVIPELIKRENDKALYSFKRIIDQNNWVDLQKNITDHIGNKKQIYDHVDFDDLVAQAIQNNNVSELLQYKGNNPFLDRENMKKIERGINTINPALAQQRQVFQQNNGHFVPVNIPAPQAPVIQPASPLYLARAYNYVTTHKKTLLTVGLTLGAVGLALYKMKNNTPVFSFWS